MNLFIVQLIKFFTLPFFLFLPLFFSYLYYDPFKVLNDYPSFYTENEGAHIGLNQDYVSTETFLKNYDFYQYDSFILGNSRSRFYEIDTWSRYINSYSGFHFDASNESLFGIYKKLQFLDIKGVNISNILLVLDFNTLNNTTNSKGHLFIKHPLLSGQSSLDFQLEFFKAYVSYNFLKAFFDFKISGQVKDYMVDSYLIDNSPVERNLKYNEMKFSLFENIIKTDIYKYYDVERQKSFSRNNLSPEAYPQVIGKEQIFMLRDIKKIFDVHSTNFKIVISPLYNQRAFNKNDLDILNKIYGSKNVYDFSGINFITSEYRNYYDPGHYRPHIANHIMSTIYK